MSQRIIEITLFLGALLLAVLATHAYLVSRSEQQKLQTSLAAQNQIILDATTHQKQRDTALSSTLADIARQKAAKQSPQELADTLAKILSLPQPIHLDSVGEPAIGVASLITHKKPLKGSGLSKRLRPGQADVTQGGNAVAFSRSFRNPPSLPDPLLGIANSGRLDSIRPPAASESTSPEPPCANSSKCPPAPQSAELPLDDLKPLYNYALDCRACQAQLAVARQNAAGDAAKIAALTRERDQAVSVAKGGTWLRRIRRNAIWFAAGAATAAAYAASHY